MKIDFIFFVGNDWTKNCSSASLERFCNIYSIATGNKGDLWWSDNQREKNAWSIHSIPTLVFALPSNGGNIGLAKLVGQQITVENVNKMMQALSKLMPNQNGTSFYNPEQPAWVQIGITQNEDNAPSGGNLLALGNDDEVNLDFDKGKWWNNPWNIAIIVLGYIGYKEGKKRKWW